MTVDFPSRQLVRLSGHKGPIHALTYSSGVGQYLLSGSSDRSINLYNPASAIASSNTTATTGLIQTYTGAHTHEVLTLAVSPDNARFISGGGDKTVFVWDVATARTVRKLSGHGGRIECVAWGGDAADPASVVVSASFDATVRLWDVKAQGSTRPMMVLGEARDSVSCVAVVGWEVMTGSVDGRMRVYDLRMGLVHVDVLGQPITSLHPSSPPTSDTILISTLDSTLHLFDKSTGARLQSYRDPSYTNTTYRIRSTLACKDNIVLAGAEDGSIFGWDVVGGEKVGRVWHVNGGGSGNTEGGGKSSSSSSRKVVSAVACRPKRSGGDEQWASAGGDGTVVVWGC